MLLCVAYYLLTKLKTKRGSYTNMVEAITALYCRQLHIILHVDIKMFTGSQIMRYVLGNVFNVGVSSNTQFLDKNTFYMTVRLQLKLQRVPLKYCRPINLMHCTVHT